MSPGSDGIPFVCWRVLGDLGADVLTDVLQVLCSPDGEAALADLGLDEQGRRLFNDGVLVLLPKNSTGVDPSGAEFFDPEGARPLNIVNADDRTLAKAIRHKVEEPLSAGIARHQWGFLRGRSMIEDTIDINEHTAGIPTDGG